MHAPAPAGSVPASTAATVTANPAWRCIDLLSDVHLHAAMPATFERWRRHLLETPADAVLMLGDLFEVWVGDDVRHSGFERQCMAALREAAAHKALAFMPGNRDFLVGDALLADCGVLRLHDPTLLLAFGQRWLLSHGDALCTADLPYQRFRVEVRSEGWQRRFLAQPLAERQQQARAMRDASMAHQAAQPAEAWSDVDDAAASEWLANADAPTLVHGHTHRPGSHALPCGRSRLVLGDWDFDTRPARARFLRLDGSGVRTVDLAAG